MSEITAAVAVVGHDNRVMTRTSGECLNRTRIPPCLAHARGRPALNQLNPKHTARDHVDVSVAALAAATSQSAVRITWTAPTP